ncbi:hypothetical protein IJG01_03690 [Candidatus Saccharibacteria bacterium]|nr:hypothetical protein [Candidatus Saccharibacteria bacterium]
MEYFEKLDAPQTDLSWNIPEQKQGTVNIIGGNSQNFRTEIKIAEFLTSSYPIQALNVVLPDALKTKLPPLPNLLFLSSTDSGSLADGAELTSAINRADANLLLGDLSKNSVTSKVIASACTSAEKPLLITRDAVDLITENANDRMLMNENLFFFASLPQLQKLFRAVYYPKMLLMSQSLIQVAEVLHKFTLSYPISLVTLHDGQILIAKNGMVKAIELTKSGYSPMMFWNGELAAKILALNLYNPHQFIDATITAITEE